MNLENLKTFIPQVENWIDRYIEKNKSIRINLASTDFERVKLCFADRTINTSFYAIVEHIETPPLSDIGVSDFLDFENGEYGGITYKDTYFVTEKEKGIESLHFHEMVHVVQWDELGPQNFILLYAIGLAQNGYRQSPLERIAYDLQAEFERNQIRASCEQRIREHSQKLLKALAG